MARRDNTDPGDRGIAPNWAWAWPANRRILYNRASCDVQGKPWAERKKLIEWNGSRWVGFDVPPSQMVPPGRRPRRRPSRHWPRLNPAWLATAV